MGRVRKSVKLKTGKIQGHQKERYTRTISKSASDFIKKEKNTISLDVLKKNITKDRMLNCLHTTAIVGDIRLVGRLRKKKRRERS